MVTILVFGDSITQGAFDAERGGWAERLKTYMWENYDIDVCNLGVSGDKTPNILRRFEPETKARIEEDEVVFIFAIGINDSYFIHSKNDFMTPPENFKDNIQEIIERARKISSKIIFLGLTPVEESKTTPIPWDTDKSYRNENVKKYNEIVKSACNNGKVYFIEIFEEWIKSDYRGLLKDGLHPNASGHKKIFEKVKDFLIQNKVI